MPDLSKDGKRSQQALDKALLQNTPKKNTIYVQPINCVGGNPLYESIRKSSTEFIRKIDHRLREVAY